MCLIKIKHRLKELLTPTDSDTNQEVMQRLYAESFMTFSMGFLLALLVAESIHYTNPNAPFLLWLSIIESIYILRVSMTCLYDRSEKNIIWLGRFRIATLVSGLAWALLALMLFQNNNVLNQFIISFTLAGLSAGVAMSYVIDRSSLFLFIIPVIFSLFTRLLLEATPLSYTMSSMVILFLSHIIISGRKNNTAILRNIEIANTSLQAEAREKSYSRVMELLANDVPLDQILLNIIRDIESKFPRMLCSFKLLDPVEKSLRHVAAPSLPDFYNRALDGLSIGIHITSCGTAAFTGQRVIAENVHTNPDWESYGALVQQAKLAACWSEPIKNLDGKVLGTIAIYYRKPTLPTEAEIEFVTQNTYFASVAIERTTFNNDLKFAALLYQNSTESMMITNVENNIVSVNPAFCNITGYQPEEVIGKNPRILSSGRQDKEFFRELWQQLNMHGKWQGELWNRKKNGEIYPELLRINTIYDQNQNVLYRVGLASDTSKAKASEDTIWRQANFDSLTGLPNRRMFHDRFQQEIKKASRSQSQLALMFLDLDHFKEVNDSLGHHTGDKLLQEAARRLVHCVRDTDTVSHMDTVARLGGDEFTIILGDLKENENIEPIVHRVLNSLSEPYQLDNEVVYISVSIGITMYPFDAEDADTLIKNADQAMYAAKRTGRNRFCYFTESMQVNIQNRMRLANDLRIALKEGQFFLLYQPIIDLSNHQIYKAEALIRWQHPSRGLVSPAEFIPIAEDTGLIIDIGNWVFQQAATQVAKWRETHHPEFQVSINKSPVQFYNTSSNKEGTHINWTNYLKNLGLPGQSISVEITERLLLDTSDSINNQLLEFRDSGIQVSLDDFGTGYSSMSYLKKFDIDYIKIDQSFVKNLEDSSDDLALCEAIIVMAHKLNMKVIAEGVETQHQLNMLKEAGCDYGQGYFFSKPIDSEAFEQLLQ